MKKISNEVKVGAVALVTILAFIWLYNYLKGKDLFSSTSHYWVVYNKVGGLTETNPVEVNGYRVGVVQSIKFHDPISGKLLVELSVDKEFKLPVNTVAEITTATLIAGMKIQLVWGNGPGFYEHGDTIPGRLAESVLTRAENTLAPVKEKVEHLIVILDSLASSINDIMDVRFRNNLKSSMASLSNTAKGIEESNLKATLENINGFTKMLSENSGKISATFTNLESVSDTIKAADLYGSVASLKSALEKTTALLEKINSGKGTAGQLITNDSLYYNLTGSLNSLNLLLQDLKANPKRYVHFSLFGKKNIPAK